MWNEGSSATWQPIQRSGASSWTSSEGRSAEAPAGLVRASVLLVLKDWTALLQTRGRRGGLRGLGQGVRLNGRD